MNTAAFHHDARRVKGNSLHRARVAAGLALFGATLTGALLGHAQHVEIFQLIGATAVVLAAKLAGSSHE